jgi:hypothetical protein
LNSEKIAAFAPIPSASDTMATPVTNGALKRVRSACFSWTMAAVLDEPRLELVVAKSCVELGAAQNRQDVPTCTSLGWPGRMPRDRSTMKVLSARFFTVTKIEAPWVMCQVAAAFQYV